MVHITEDEAITNIEKILHTKQYSFEQRIKLIEMYLSDKDVE